jgi:hypothetical protein
MAKRQPDPVLPFRWDLARREQLGTAVRGAGTAASLWFADELVACAAKVLDVHHMRVRRTIAP